MYIPGSCYGKYTSLDSSFELTAAAFFFFFASECGLCLSISVQPALARDRWALPALSLLMACFPPRAAPSWWLCCPSAGCNVCIPPEKKKLSCLSIWNGTEFFKKGFYKDLRWFGRGFFQLQSGLQKLATKCFANPGGNLTSSAFPEPRRNMNC